MIELRPGQWHLSFRPVTRPALATPTAFLAAAAVAVAAVAASGWCAGLPAAEVSCEAGWDPPAPVEPLAGSPLRPDPFAAEHWAKESPIAAPSPALAPFAPAVAPDDAIQDWNVSEGSIERGLPAASLDAPDARGFRDDPPPGSFEALRTRLLNDAAGFATAPFRWGASGWTQFAFLSAVIGGSMAWADHNADLFNQVPSRGQKRFWQVVSNNNATWTFGLEAILFTAGYGFGVPRAQTVWLETIEATTVASGILSPLLKLAVGRQRPDAGSDAHVFKPFSGNASFPSGHTTQAFVVATAVAVAYADHPWVGVLTFTAAGMVGYSRLFLHKHFLSDVLAGALLGGGVGYEAVALHRHWFGNGDGADSAAGAEGEGGMPELSVVTDGLSTGLQMTWHF